MLRSNGHTLRGDLGKPRAARPDRFASIVPDELLHFLANVSPSAIGKERNEGKSLPPWRCHFHTLDLAACQRSGHSKEMDWTSSSARRGEKEPSARTPTHQQPTFMQHLSSSNTSLPA
ncbi:hypothetical protein KOW79_015810 [Hemibagrus wyckioides]|uniref:Uncharacterized protein n=1 Tax=Hemibagrus wyckioides TaxID=337641 RepID=A0A9D3SF30_9TELE|nr:hypothetical protein KOW79_015810 [Hemibagrus wyckioides]